MGSIQNNGTHIHTKLQKKVYKSSDEGRYERRRKKCAACGKKIRKGKNGQIIGEKIEWFSFLKKRVYVYTQNNNQQSRQNKTQ